MHFVGGPDPRLTLGLGRARVVGAELQALKRVDLEDFVVVDRVLGHHRKHTQDVPGAFDGPALVPEHVVDERGGVAAAEIDERPVLKWDSLDFHVEELPDFAVAVVIGSL